LGSGQSSRESLNWHCTDTAQDVIGRFIAFPTTDLQANADINFNVTKLATATFDFTGSDNLNDTIRRLESNGTDRLAGNKGFWASDYMVGRLTRCAELCSWITRMTRFIGGRTSF
jgi:hypothetical protein